MTNLQALQITLAGVSVLTLVMTALFVQRKPTRWHYAIPPASWLFHLLVYHGFMFARDTLGIFIGLDFSIWLLIILLQAAFLILGVMVMLVYERLIFTR